MFGWLFQEPSYKSTTLISFNSAGRLVNKISSGTVVLPALFRMHNFYEDLCISMRKFLGRRENITEGQSRGIFKGRR